MSGRAIKKLIAGSSLALAALTAGATLAGPAGAASNVASKGVPGRVIEDGLPVRCSKFLVNGQLTKYVTADGPTVYGARLSNGSTGQYVMYQENVFDYDTGRWSNGPWSSWAYATTTQGAKLPNQQQTGVYNNRQFVQIVLWWWDPVSKTYTGEMDYLVNQYFHFNYDNPYNTYSYC